MLLAIDFTNLHEILQAKHERRGHKHRDLGRHFNPGKRFRYPNTDTHYGAGKGAYSDFS